LGWINLDLTNTNYPGITNVTWIHPERASGLYTRAFINVVPANQIMISPWTNPPANIDLLTNLVIVDTFSGTNVMNFAVTISSNFKLGEVSGPESLSGCLNPKTGLLTVTLGSGANKTSCYGAVLLNSYFGGGYFLGKTNAGMIMLVP